MTPPLFLFDIDGTLLTTNGIGRRAFNRAAQRLFGNHFTFDDITFSGHLDPLIFAEAAAQHRLDDPHLHHERFRDAYLAELGTLLAAEVDGGVVVLPGVHLLLERLRQHAAAGDVVLGVLTGNYGASARLKLTRGGIDPDMFAITAFGDEAPTRAELVAVAMEKHRRQTGVAASAERVVVIGDTPRDVACAQINGCVAFAVATGAYDLATLRQAGADIVVNDLRDGSRLLELIDHAVAQQSPG